MKISFIFLISTILILLPVPRNPIVGAWKLVSYDAIDHVKASPAYQYGDSISRSMIDQQFEAILSRGEYIFGLDTLRYTDLEGSDIIYRRALWQVEGDYLKIQEIDRNFEREAFIRKLEKDSLVISPIIEGEIRESEMVFVKRK